MENVHVRYSSISILSRERLFRTFTFFQELTHEIIEQLFQVAGKLVRDQTEITSIPVIGWQQQMWQRTTLLTDKVVQFATAKTCLFRYSAVFGRIQLRSRWSLEGQDPMVH